MRRLNHNAPAVGITMKASVSRAAESSVSLIHDSRLCRKAGSSIPSTPDGDAAWTAATRASLAQVDAQLAAQFDQSVDVDRLVEQRATAVDALIRATWSRCVPTDAGLALFAIGGYGRGELFPQSDIDLLVLAGDAAQQAHRDALARFLWGGAITLTEVGSDKYAGRIVARVLTQTGADAGAHMLEEGYAIAYDGGRRQPWCGPVLTARR